MDFGRTVGVDPDCLDFIICIFSLPHDNVYVFGGEVRFSGNSGGRKPHGGRQFRTFWRDLASSGELKNSGGRQHSGKLW